MPNPFDFVMFVLPTWGAIEYCGDFQGESNVI